MKPYEVTNPNDLSAAERREYEDWLARMDAEQDTYDDIAKQVATQNAEYEKQWPNHCKACGGWGITTWTENASPLGSGEYWPMDMSDPCEKCYGAGKCGRCGAELPVTPDEFEEPLTPCNACGWESGESGIQSFSM